MDFNLAVVMADYYKPPNLVPHQLSGHTVRYSQASVEDPEWFSGQLLIASMASSNYEVAPIAKLTKGRSMASG